MSNNLVFRSAMIVAEPVRQGKNVKYQMGKLTVALPAGWSLYHTWDGCHGVPMVSLDDNNLVIHLKRDKELAKEE